MDGFIVPGSILFVLGLLHYSYLDLRIRGRGGIAWFWTAWQTPPLLWLSRAAMLASFVATLAVFGIGLGERVAAVIAGLFALHIALLEALLLREEPDSGLESSHHPSEHR